MKYETVRRFALALADTTEVPHHHFGSFRVKGRIFVTVPPDREHLHVFVSEPDREVALALHPGFTEKLLWGGKTLGLRVRLATATPSVVKALVTRAYETRVLKDAGPKRSTRMQGVFGRATARGPKGEMA